MHYAAWVFSLWINVSVKCVLKIDCDERGMKDAIKSCFVRDERRPLGIGIQVQVSNCLLVLQTKAVVLSVTGKG